MSTRARMLAFAIAMPAGAAVALEKPARTILPAGSDVFVVSVGAFDFGPLASTESYTAVTFGDASYLLRGTTPSGITALLASPRLPTGAVIDNIELHACDFDAAEDVTLYLHDCLDDADGPGGCTALGLRWPG